MDNNKYSLWIEKAQAVQCDESLSENQKGKCLSALMTDMEGCFNIPILRDLEWESRNREVMEIYRKISDMRFL